ncbi:jmjC domain-containing protein E-like [Watersipora subatra]|uniref:jmjC domain-containing protein E-like n=1 Tax=Watersipora subatra TaxID=2589382 RepID=UPI00355AD1B1
MMKGNLAEGLALVLTFLHIAYSIELPGQHLELGTCLLVLIPGPLHVEDKASNMGCDNSKEVCDASSKSTCEFVHRQFSEAFSTEPMVQLIYREQINQGWLLSSLSKHLNSEDNCSLVIYPKPIKDRTCLLSPQHTIADPTIIQLSTSISNHLAVVNQVCNTFRNVNGGLDRQGLHRDYIRDSLFSVESMGKYVNAEEAFKKGATLDILPKCEKVAITSWQEFFIEYLQHSKPVVITNAIQNWNVSHWTNDYLMEKYGNKSVHIKLSPTRDYEGIEAAELWETFESFEIPRQVYEQLEHPDLVVPRPAPTNMKFSEYIYLMQNISTGKIKNVSAYLEYSSIRQYFPELEEDISEMSFVESYLKLKHLNIWLSDGNTVGKLHFDPFDNFLCMIDGRKELLLFEPHDNQQLYEAHIPEAEFSVSLNGYHFRRNKLLESTSMVMSPIDIHKPDFQRFPKFKQAKPLNCTIEEGEVLFMPAFWWHEVQSYPSLTKNRNLAVNYWYEPYLSREFPCQSCKLDVNPYYNFLL